MLRLPRILLVLLCATLGLASRAGADPVLPPQEIDLWVEGTGETRLDLAQTPLPPGFFGPNSLAFGGTVIFGGINSFGVDVGGGGGIIGLPGATFGGTPFGGFGLVDSMRMRSLDPFDRCDDALPCNDVIPVQIVALNLTSVQPILVQFQGGGTEEWEVGLGLGGGAPPVGQMFLEQNRPNGGVFTPDLPVVPRLIFARPADLQAVRDGILDPLQIEIHVIDLTPLNLQTVAPVPFSFDSPFVVGGTGFFPGVNSPPAFFLLLSPDGSLRLSVILAPPPGAAPVPEPGTLLSAAIGLAGLAFWQRRRRRSPGRLSSP
ncbi:MAG: PEP-CTERM sorting domain-containing protein [Planctomycetes bacterium]|nr:PEP-CTERM sorting domain-containing protein [Planctomycetota bacterium]